LSEGFASPPEPSLSTSLIQALINDANPGDTVHV
jgi:hypothetical protein